MELFAWVLCGVCSTRVDNNRCSTQIEEFKEEVTELQFKPNSNLFILSHNRERKTTAMHYQNFDFHLLLSTLSPLVAQCTLMFTPGQIQMIEFHTRTGGKRMQRQCAAHQLLRGLSRRGAPK